MLLTNVFNLLFPKLCLGCSNALLKNEVIICTHCRHNLPFTYQHLYRENDSFKKFYGRLALENCSSLLYFTKKGLVQKLFHQLKYNNHSEISYFLGRIYSQQLKETELLKTIDAIIPVPIHRKKLITRGYNQVNGFAKAISESFNIVIEDKILFQRRQKISQTKKNIFERTLQNNETFGARFNSNHHNKHYLILDDIVTTGGTLESCGKQILKIPKSKISFLCLAQSV